MATYVSEIRRLKHHEPLDICASRAKYREGRKDTAVKVYTVNLESLHLLIHGVPAVGCKTELEDLCGEYGAIDEIKVLDEYPSEEFTEVYYVKFCNLREARLAKRKLDNQTFFGGHLHVCYAPEFESIEETRQKLQERRRLIAFKTRSKHYSQATGEEKEIYPQTDYNSDQVKKHEEFITYVWAGKTYTVPKTQENATNSSSNVLNSHTSNCVAKNKDNNFIPRQLQKHASPSSCTPIIEERDNFSSTRNLIQTQMKKFAEPYLEVKRKKRKL